MSAVVHASFDIIPYLTSTSCISLFIYFYTTHNPISGNICYGLHISVMWNYSNCQIIQHVQSQMFHMQPKHKFKRSTFLQSPDLT